MKKAFTLIELLVVVLIIGILAAVALPKYELAVEKSRLAEALTMASSLQKAIDVYLLENGYPSDQINFLGNKSNGNGSLAIDLSNLDCSVSDGLLCVSKNFQYTADCRTNGICVISVTREKTSDMYSFAFLKEGTDAWHGHECDYSTEDPIGEKICKQLEARGDGFWLCPDC